VVQLPHVLQSESIDDRSFSVWADVFADLLFVYATSGVAFIDKLLN
jgi:hypothetical protein